MPKIKSELKTKIKTLEDEIEKNDNIENNKTTIHFYFNKIDNENKKDINIKNDNKLEYIGLYKDSYLNEEIVTKNDDDKQEKCTKQDNDMIVNDLKLFLQQKGYEVIHNNKILKIPIDKNYEGVYQDTVKEHMPISENGNRFILKTKLPNGELIDIRKRFKPSINRDEVMDEMKLIRDNLINEHYIIGAKENEIVAIPDQIITKVERGDNLHGTVTKTIPTKTETKLINNKLKMKFKIKLKYLIKILIFLQVQIINLKYKLNV